MANSETSTVSVRSSAPVSINAPSIDLLSDITSQLDAASIFFEFELTLRLICEGAFGEVRMCVHRESGAQRAVKVLRKSHMDEDEKRMLFNEINILKEIVCASKIFLA